MRAHRARKKYMYIDIASFVLGNELWEEHFESLLAYIIGIIIYVRMPVERVRWYTSVVYMDSYVVYKGTLDRQKVSIMLLLCIAIYAIKLYIVPSA